MTFSPFDGCRFTTTSFRPLSYLIMVCRCPCHSERSEESLILGNKILRCTQINNQRSNDNEVSALLFMSFNNGGKSNDDDDTRFDMLEGARVLQK